VEAKYEREYSASVDPFTAWRLKERERGRAGMALHDRMLYAAGQAVATNSCVAPHVLLPVTLCRLSHCFGKTALPSSVSFKLT